MTHIENIPHIFQYGITHADSPNANPDYVPIGDNSLISRRNDFIVPDGRTLGEYIPFYFGVCMPMLYVIQNGFNAVKATPAEDIVYCITSVQQIINHQLDFVFTDGHAVDSFSSFYSLPDINNIEHYIDQNAIKRQFWKDENDLDLKRRKEAEFLIDNDIPSAAILGFAVYDEYGKNRLIGFGIAANKVIVNKGFYF
jgi:hypothetical protein